MLQRGGDLLEREGRVHLRAQASVDGVRKALVGDPAMRGTRPPTLFAFGFGGGDAMHLDWDVLLGREQWVLVANLPYNVATPLVLDLLEGVPQVVRMLVMVQHEVAERLAAGAGEPGRGAVSVKVEYFASARTVGRVPATVFVPKPRVESALVRLERHAPAPVDVDRFRLFELVETGFGQRRKMLRRSLASVVSPECFAEAGVAPEARPEELDLDAWARLTRCASNTPGPS